MRRIQKQKIKVLVYKRFSFSFCLFVCFHLKNKKEFVSTSFLHELSILYKCDQNKMTFLKTNFLEFHSKCYLNLTIFYYPEFSNHSQPTHSLQAARLLDEQAGTWTGCCCYSAVWVAKEVAARVESFRWRRG